MRLKSKIVARIFPFMFPSLVDESAAKFNLSERVYELQMILKNHLIYEESEVDEI